MCKGNSFSLTIIVPYDLAAQRSFSAKSKRSCKFVSILKKQAALLNAYSKGKYLTSLVRSPTFETIYEAKMFNLEQL